MLDVPYLCAVHCVVGLRRVYAGLLRDADEGSARREVFQSVHRTQQTSSLFPTSEIVPLSMGPHISLFASAALISLIVLP